MTPPPIEARLEYPRQAIATASYTDNNNLADENLFAVIDVVPHDVDDIITNPMWRVM